MPGHILRNKIILLLLLCASYEAAAQNPAASDSLKRLLDTLPRPSQAVVLNDISWNYSTANADSALHYARAGEKVAREWSDSSALARSLILQGIALSAQDELQSILLTEQALGIAFAISDSNHIASALNNLAIEDMNIGNSRSALERLQQSLDYTVADTLGKVITLGNIGQLYSELGDEQKATEYLKLALQEAEQSADSSLMLEAAYNKALVLMDQSGQLDSAVYYMEEALRLARSLNDYISTSFALLNLGGFYSEQELYEKSARYLKDALQLSTSNQFTEGVQASLIELAELYLKTGKPRLAEAQLNQLDPMSINVLRERFFYHDLKTRLYRELRMYKKALSEQDSLIRYRDSLSGIEKQRELMQEELAHQLQHKEQDMELLRLQRKTDRQQLRQQRMLLIGLGILFLIVLMGGLLYAHHRSRFRKALEAQVAAQTAALRKTNTELEQTNQELERFAHIASHDLKEPLRNIISFVTLLERRLSQFSSPSPDIADYFNHIQRSARQMHTLIRDLLAYSQIRSLEPEDTETFELSEVLQSIEHDIRSLLEEKNAVLEYGQAGKVSGNRHHYYSIFKNLIENGIKYNVSSRPVIRIEQACGEQGCTVKVTDNGIGIPAEFRDKVFDMFYRLHTKAAYEGTGLGLAIVRRLLNLMGASIRAEDGKPEGTTFILDFPLPVQEHAFTVPSKASSS